MTPKTNTGKPKTPIEDLGLPKQPRDEDLSFRETALSDEDAEAASLEHGALLVPVPADDEQESE